MERTVTDRELAAAAAGGSVQDFEMLVKRYSRKLYLFVFSKTGNREETEDILQDTFLKAYKNLKSYSPEWNFSTWIYTIASRTAVSRFRYMSLRKNTELSPDPPVETPEDVLLRNDTSPVWEAARTLGSGKYEILRLRYREGFSTDEIAKITGRSSVNIRVTLFRSKNRLMQILNEQGGLEDALNKGPEKIII